MAGRRPVGRQTLIDGRRRQLHVLDVSGIGDGIRVAPDLASIRSLPLGNRRRRPRRRTDAQNTATASDGTDSTAANAPAARTATVATAAVATATRRRRRLGLPRFRHVVLFVLVNAPRFRVPFLVQLIENRLCFRLTFLVLLALKFLEIDCAIDIHDRALVVDGETNVLFLPQSSVTRCEQLIAQVICFREPVTHRLAQRQVMSLRGLDLFHVSIRARNEIRHPPVGAVLRLRLDTFTIILEVLARIIGLGHLRMGVTRAGILLEVPGIQRLDIQVLQRLQAIIIRR